MLPSLHSILTAFAVSATALSLCSCETAFPRTPAEDPSLQGDLNNAKPNPEAGFSYWKDEGATGPVNLKIDLSEQAAYIYRGNTQVGRTRIATGLPTHPTPTGSFTIIEKIANKQSNLYGQIVNADGSINKSDADSRIHKVPPGGRFVGADMPNWMRLTDRGVGMHIGPIPNPGSPASHGCIRLPADMAGLLFDHTEIGTPVVIVE